MCSSDLRSLEDAALIGECLIAHDPADPDTRLGAAQRLAETCRSEPPATPRLAFVKSPAWDKADAATQAAFGELAEFLGDACDEVALPPEFDAAIGDHRTIMHADLARFLGRYMDRGEDRISEVLRGMIGDGKTVRAVDYNASIDRITPLADWVESLCEDYDAILTPAACGEAPLGLDATGDPVFCTTWTYLGVPAVTLPPSRKIVRSLPSVSMSVDRGCSSVSKVTVSRPLRTSIGRICSLKRPSSIATRARS